jgi:hypothetical protein
MRVCLFSFMTVVIIVQYRLRWFEHIPRSHLEPVHSGLISQTANGKRAGGRPNLTRRNTLALDRREWKLTIHELEP